MTDTARYRLDDLRRLATALGAGVGVAPARASALAAGLLWFDAAGAAPFGIAALPGWLERIEARAVDPLAEGKVGHEMTGTAVLDGQNGLPPLILARAAGLAGEKARDAGVGLIRVIHIGPTGPAAHVTAELAVGPYAGLALGPGPKWSIALPSAEGLPAVYDSALTAPGPEDAGPALRVLAPWAEALATEDGWLVAAVAVAALEPLATFHERLAAALKRGDEAPGRLLPDSWEARRRDAREHGVTLDAATRTRLQEWAERLHVDFPAPVAPPSRAHAPKKKDAGKPG